MIRGKCARMFGLRNKATGKMIFYYWASLRPHKALFVTRAEAEDAARRMDEDTEIVEF